MRMQYVVVIISVNQHELILLVVIMTTEYQRQRCRII